MTQVQRREIPLLDLQTLHAPLRPEILSEIARVVDSQRFIMGADVQELERLIAEYCGTRHAVACASGSDALYLALRAAGVKPGDRVLTTPYSFFATAGSISLAGATPVFADIDPVTYNLDPAAAARTLETTAGITAIIPVHLFGGCADMDAFLEAARRHNCTVIEDGAQAIGASYKGRKALSMAGLGCLSFFPTKNLGAFGDGGMVLTNDAELAARIASLRLHGSVRKYHHELIGINSRLDTLQAAILKVKLRYLESWTARRQSNARLYRELLRQAGAPVTVPVEASYQSRHVYNQFVIRTSRRDELRAWLRENGVSTEIYYPAPLHLQACYRDLGYTAGAFPNSEDAARESLALPVHPALSREDIEYIVTVIADFFQTHAI